MNLADRKVESFYLLSNYPRKIAREIEWKKDIAQTTKSFFNKNISNSMYMYTIVTK